MNLTRSQDDGEGDEDEHMKEDKWTTKIKEVIITTQNWILNTRSSFCRTVAEKIIS